MCTRVLIGDTSRLKTAVSTIAALYGTGMERRVRYRLVAHRMITDLSCSIAALE